MSNLEIEQIWDKQRALEEVKNKFSTEELKRFKDGFSSEITLASRRFILFDSIYKFIVVLGYILLLFIGEITMLKVGISVLVPAALVFLGIKNIQLDGALKGVDISKDIMTVQKKQYALLNRVSHEFLLSSSFTHPFFVLAGFQFYQLLKYKEDQLIVLLSDPVIYVFLLLSFIVPFVVQKISYAKELDDLAQVIDIELDETGNEVNLINLYERKRARLIGFILLFLVGSLLLFIILNLIG